MSLLAQLSDLLAGPLPWPTYATLLLGNLAFLYLLPRPRLTLSYLSTFLFFAFALLTLVAITLETLRHLRLLKSSPGLLVFLLTLLTLVLIPLALLRLLLSLSSRAGDALANTLTPPLPPPSKKTPFPPSPH